ncbi:MAG: peptide/nickel transport system permease protein [Microbacteriaceae bacterium]|jgi:peptide/nickel transport system permease protein|nr:peptide/nickel transport system permease protein [Microbacteriaceae bacterium]MDQ1577665.1 peptide/nickel transport system permease protein [Microbacteriaceae bacterium]
MLRRLQFIPGRLIQTIPVVFGVTLVVFFLGHVLPGDPAIAILGEHATPARVAALREQLGLNLPLWTQYGQFVLHIVQGNLGQSLTYQSPVSSLVLQAIPVTLSLLLFALLISLVISVPLAGLAAAKPGGVWDYIARGYTLLGQGMPQFWVGVMLLLLLAVGLRAFPVGGYGATPLDHVYYLFLPALTMGIAMSPTIVRSLRSSTIDVLGSEYIATARSKGSSGTALFRQHVLRNALIPTVSIIGVHLGYLVGGSIVIEKVFALPGLGSLMLNAILSRDFPTIQAVSLVVALFVVAVGILTDIVYTLLDPRINLSGGGEGA